MHYSEIAEVVLAVLGLENEIQPKTINTSLHEDPRHRFFRVGSGTWILRDPSKHP